jgi:hypothetical protein
MIMRRTTYLICLFMLLAVGCREVNSQKSPPVSGSKIKEQAQVVQEGTPAPQTNPPAKVTWTPPANPDPHQILNEAREDTRAGRYEEALAKHVWFHRNVLQIDPAFYGVRLSSALDSWKELASVYPAAKTKLMEIRDEAEKQVTSGANVGDSFNDFEEINRVIGDDKRTVALFKSLDNDNVQAAGEVFDIARPALIKAGEIKLCGKYVDPKDYPRQVEMYRQLMSLAADPQFSKEHTDFAKQRFSNDVTTLVALLVLSDRKTEAETVATDAKTVWADKAFAGALDKAMEGHVPEPWP